MPQNAREYHKTLHYRFLRMIIKFAAKIVVNRKIFVRSRMARKLILKYFVEVASRKNKCVLIYYGFHLRINKAPCI